MLDKELESIIKGIAPELILKFLAVQPAHGYAMINHIRRAYNVYLGPSTIYPLLADLQKKGFVKSAWNEVHENERPRKVYTLTAAGFAELAQMTQMLSMVVRADLVTAQ